MWLRSLVFLLLAYGVAGAAALIFTRFDGGVAFLWIATAILIAALMRTATRRWPLTLALCGTISALNTGLLGLGWAAAVPFAVVNLLEATVAVLLLRRWAQSSETLRSLSWFARYVVALALVAPLLATGMAGLALAALGRFTGESMLHYVSGYALGNLSITPIAMMLTDSRLAGRLGRCCGTGEPTR